MCNTGKKMAFVFIAFTALSAASQAQTQPTDGRNEAAAACESASFNSDRIKCIGIVNQASYFDLYAVRACRDEIDFSSDLPNCMQAIQNKTFMPAEVTICAGQSFGSEIVKCFAGAGKPAIPVYEPRPGTDEFILRTLIRIQDNLKLRKIHVALLDLANLISFVQEGMKRP